VNVKGHFAVSFAGIRRFGARTVKVSCLLVLGLIFVFPFYWMLSTSFKSLAETVAFPPALLPERFLLENYAEAWRMSNFPHAAANSLFVALSVLALQICVMLPAAYAFAFKKFRGSGLFFSCIVIGLMVPPQVTFLPLYLFFSRLRLINTAIPLILPFASSAFGIFLLTQSFRRIPIELVEAAKLDGASETRIVTHILLPSVIPALVTFALFSFVSHWNDYFWVLSMTNDETMRTLPVAVVNLTESEGLKNWHVKMAGNMLLVAPILLVYWGANKWIKRAFAYNGIK
jgi:sn-glycerol 3-phosphate transport system permease protein